MGKFVLIVLHDDKINTLIKVNNKNEEYIKILENGKCTIYLWLSQAIYGTVAWHEIDFKISHKEEKVVREVIKEIENEYGEMMMNTGDTQTYCGMTLKYINQTVVINMNDYLLEAIDKLKIEYN